MVTTDVTRFYSSVYTHALPWAILGKARAKRLFAARTLAGHWSDRLDILTRKLNGDQTVGIPTGSDTSLVLAEAILARIDQEVRGRHPSVPGIRYIDDYEFVTQTKGEAESLLSTLQVALRAFELELNPTKTVIAELPLPLNESWVADLRRQPVSSARSGVQHEQLSDYFGSIFETMKRLPSEQILKYGLARLGRVLIHSDNWLFYQHLLQQCVAVDAGCLPLVAADLEYYRRDGRALDPNWSEVLNRTVIRNLPVGNSSESAWALALLLQFQFPLHADAARLVGVSDDAISALLASMLAHSARASWQDLGDLSRFLSPDNLYTQQWLLCYESNVWNWHGANGASLQADPWFSHLHQGPSPNVVTFLDFTAQVQPSVKVEPEEDDEESHTDLDLY